MSTFRLLTYNIHKGFTASNRHFILEALRNSVQEAKPDLVFLQEVVGQHDAHASRLKDWPTTSQFEYLAGQTWPHFAYGKNAIYTEGHHGNALLSKFPIVAWENEDVSLSKIERRGILHATLTLPNQKHPLHAFCLHLGLFEKDRTAQLHKLSARIAKHVDPEAPVIIAGDFNDWRQNASAILAEKLNLKEVFLEKTKTHAYTYPSWYPVLALDRVYYRNLDLHSVQLLKGETWRKLSDHLPLAVEFKT